MKPLGVHHVALNVDDVEAAVRFYRDVLGLTLRSDRPDLGLDGAWLDAGEEQVHLLQAPMPPGCGQHFALAVARLDEVVRELRGRGVEVSEPSVVGGDRQCFVSDPCGNLIELHEPAARARTSPSATD